MRHFVKASHLCIAPILIIGSNANALKAKSLDARMHRIVQGMTFLFRHKVRNVLSRTCDVFGLHFYKNVEYISKKELLQ